MALISPQPKCDNEVSDVIPEVTPPMDNLNSIEETSIITFGQLLQIKREAMGLNISEAQRRMGIWGVGKTEQDINTPTQKNLSILIKFYNITENELNSCKMLSSLERRVAANYKKTRVQDRIIFKNIQNTKLNNFGIKDILEKVQLIIDKVALMSEEGLLALSMKTEAESKLKQAKSVLIDILILDKLLD